MMMCKHHQTMKNQSALKHSVAGDITMQVLRGVVTARDLSMSRMVQLHRTTSPHPLLRHGIDTMCDPFENWQIVKYMGVVLAVVAATTNKIVQRAPQCLGLPRMGGFSLKMAAFSMRGTFPKSSKRLSSCT